MWEIECWWEVQTSNVDHWIVWCSGPSDLDTEPVPSPAADLQAGRRVHSIFRKGEGGWGAAHCTACLIFMKHTLIQKSSKKTVFLSRTPYHQTHTHDGVCTWLWNRGQDCGVWWSLKQFFKLRSYWAWIFVVELCWIWWCQVTVEVGWGDIKQFCMGHCTLWVTRIQNSIGHQAAQRPNRSYTQQLSSLC